MNNIYKISEITAYLLLIPLLAILLSYGLFMAFDISGEHIRDGFYDKMTAWELARAVLARVVEVIAAGITLTVSLYLMLKSVFWLMNPTKLPFKFAISCIALIAAMAIYHGIGVLVRFL